MKNGKPFALRSKWCIRWSDENGKRRRQIFDNYGDAEHVLAVQSARISEVKRGLRAGDPPKKTFSELLFAQCGIARLVAELERNQHSVVVQRV